MRSFQSEFSSRRAHVKRYLALVCKTERINLARKVSLSETSINVLRAGTFLVLYNLVEASARNAVEAIHDELNSKQIPFHLLRSSLRREVIRGFKQHGKPDVQMNMTNVPCELVSAALNVDDHFSGNVDARLIRKIAGVYGFATSTNRAVTRDGSTLLTIKETRNDLAHGLKTYDEVGRQYPAKQLIDLSIRSTAYVSEMLKNVSDYLDSSQFLEEENS